MSILNCLTNVVKATVAVAASPAAVLADVCTLPSSGYDGRPAFGRTAKLMDMAGDYMKEAVTPDRDSA